jgi:hypothetical protein
MSKYNQQTNPVQQQFVLEAGDLTYTPIQIANILNYTRFSGVVSNFDILKKARELGVIVLADNYEVSSSLVAAKIPNCWIRRSHLKGLLRTLNIALDEAEISKAIKKRETYIHTGR